MIHVVSGSGRAGTSMMMGCLEQGGIPILYNPTLQNTGKDDNFPHFSHPLFHQTGTISTIAGCEKLHGHAMKVSETILERFPKSLIPEVKIIWMWRKPECVLASQKHAMETRGLAPIMMFPNEYLSMQKYFRRKAKKLGFDVLDVRYEKVLKSPLKALKRVGKFIDPGFDFGKAAMFVDPLKQRQK